MNSITITFFFSEQTLELTPKENVTFKSVISGIASKAARTCFGVAVAYIAEDGNPL